MTNISLRVYAGGVGCMHLIFAYVCLHLTAPYIAYIACRGIARAHWPVRASHPFILYGIGWCNEIDGQFPSEPRIECPATQSQCQPASQPQCHTTPMLGMDDLTIAAAPLSLCECVRHQPQGADASDAYITSAHERPANVAPRVPSRPARPPLRHTDKMGWIRQMLSVKML